MPTVRDALHPGDGGPLERYWTRGAGLARWVSSPTPFRTLVALLSKHVSPSFAKRLSATYFFKVHGFWPGHRKGKNPVGPG